jgi:hypothetical protein
MGKLFPICICNDLEVNESVSTEVLSYVALVQQGKVLLVWAG